MKFIGRFFTIMVDVVLICIVVLAFAVRTFKFQTFLAQKATSFLSAELGTKMKVDEVAIVLGGDLDVGLLHGGALRLVDGRGVGERERGGARFALRAREEQRPPLVRMQPRPAQHVEELVLTEMAVVAVLPVEVAEPLLAAERLERRRVRLWQERVEGGARAVDTR